MASKEDGSSRRKNEEESPSIGNENGISGPKNESEGSPSDTSSKAKSILKVDPKVVPQKDKNTKANPNVGAAKRKRKEGNPNEVPYQLPREEDSSGNESDSTESSSDNEESDLSAQSSSVSDYSEEESEKEEFVAPPRKKRKKEGRFCPLSKEEDNAWDLSKDLAKYTTKNFNTYVSEKSIKHSILEKCPIPDNIGKPKNLDSFAIDLLLESHKKFVLENDKVLKKTQSKIYDVMGPLGTIWEEIRTIQNKDGKAKLSGDKVITMLDQTVLLLGQVNNSINFQRRSNVMRALVKDKNKASTLIKDNDDVFKPKSKKLFGSKFEKALKRKAKAKKASKSVLCEFQPRKQYFPKSPSGRGAHNSSSQNNSRNSYPRDSYTSQQHRGKKSFFFRGKNSSSQKLSNSKEGKGNITITFVYNKDSTSRENTPDNRKVNNSNKGGQTSCRPIKAFLPELGEVNKRPVGLEYNKRSKCRLHKIPKAGKNSNRNRDVKNPKRLRRQGDQRAFGERSNKGSRSPSRPVCKLNFPEGKEGWNIQINSKPEKFKRKHSIPKVQNGRPKAGEGFDKGKRLHGQTGHEGCLFQRATPPKLSEICQVYVERNSLRICMSMFWTRTRSKNFYETVKSSDTISEKAEYTSNNISGRHFGIGRDNGINFRGKRHSTTSATEPRVCDKLGEVLSTTQYQNGVSRDIARLQGNDHLSSRGENIEYNQSLSGNVTKRDADLEGDCNDNRQADFHILSSTASDIELQTLTNATDTGHEREGLVRSKDKPKSTILSGTKLVGGKPEVAQWSPSQNEPTRHNHTIGCRKNGGLGGTLPRNSNGGPVEQMGIPPTHKCSGINCCKTGNHDFCDHEATEDDPSTNRQYSGPCVHSKNGQHKESHLNKPSQGNMAVFNATWDHDYVRIHTKRQKCHSGCGIEREDRPQRMDVMSNNIQKPVPAPQLSTRHRPICIKALPSVKRLHVMESRPLLQSSGCNSATMETIPPICFPTLLLDRKSTKKGKSGRSDNDFSDSYLANTALVSPSVKHVHRETTSTPTVGKSTQGSKGKTPSIKRGPPTRGMASIRERALSEGVSEQTAELISDFRTEGTKKAYKSSWTRWSRWCGGRKINPIQCPLKDILDFLSDCFHKNQEYRTINKHRSAISAYHEPIGGIPVGQLELVCKLMKGISNNRTPGPRLLFVWDVEEVLGFIELMGPNKELNDKDLTIKTVALLSICLVKRGSEVARMDLNHMNKSKNRFIFGLPGRLKHSKQGQKIPPLYVLPFPENTLLCPVKALESYIDRTSAWRSQGETRLFISFKKPHKGVSPKTISRWLMLMLQKANIDTSKFTAHSYRSAGSSKARKQGVSARDILKQGNWKGKKVWETHYNKEIVQKDFFQSAVLQKT